MAVETLGYLDRERSETEVLGVPETAKDFDEAVREILGDQLTEVSEQEIDTASLHWRGLNPAEGFGLLSGQSSVIELRSKFPNTSTDWHKAIAYNQGGESTRYNMALGFLPEDDWSIKPAASHVSHDLKQFPETLRYQLGNFIVNGRLHKPDIRYVVVRAHGQKPGQVGSCKFYRISTELN